MKQTLSPRSWKHTGFSVHNSVNARPEDAGLDRAARPVCDARPGQPGRMEIKPDLSEVRLRPKAGADDGPDEGFERLYPDEVPSRLRRLATSLKSDRSQDGKCAHLVMIETFRARSTAAGELETVTA